MKIIIALLVALAVFVLIKAAKIGLKRLATLYPGWNFRPNLLGAFGFIMWLVYIFWAMDYLLKDKFYYQYLVIALILIVAGFIAWYLINDIIAGIIFKVKHDLKAGTHIRTVNYSGLIISYHLTYIQIRMDDGQLIRVPYSRINQEVISEVAHSASEKKHTIHLQIDSSLNKADAETLIRQSILNSPWSNLKEEPSIKFLEETRNGNIFEVMLFSIDLEHIKFIEQALEENSALKVI